MNCGMYRTKESRYVRHLGCRGIEFLRCPSVRTLSRDLAAARGNGQPLCGGPNNPSGRSIQDFGETSDNPARISPTSSELSGLESSPPDPPHARPGGTKCGTLWRANDRPRTVATHAPSFE